MSFSRDIGVVTTEEVVGAAEEATAHARGVLLPAKPGVRPEGDAEKLARLRKVVGRGENLSQDDRNTLKHLNMVEDGAQHPPEEVAAMATATKLAAVGVGLMGGKAHVSFGGSYREVEDPDTGRGLKRMQTSITVTVTVTSGKGEEPSVKTPAQDVIGGPGALPKG